jgi:hypothetical protein
MNERDLRPAIWALDLERFEATVRDQWPVELHDNLYEWIAGQRALCNRVADHVRARPHAEEIEAEFQSFVLREFARLHHLSESVIDKRLAMEHPAEPDA